MILYSQPEGKEVPEMFEKAVRRQSSIMCCRMLFSRARFMTGASGCTSGYPRMNGC